MKMNDIIKKKKDAFQKSRNAKKVHGGSKGLPKLRTVKLPCGCESGGDTAGWRCPMHGCP